MQNNKQETTTNYNNTRRLVLFAALTMLVIFTAAAGAIASCKYSGGEFDLENKVCKKLQVVGLCEFKGQKYLSNLPLVNSTDLQQLTK